MDSLRAAVIGNGGLHGRVSPGKVGTKLQTLAFSVARTNQTMRQIVYLWRLRS